MKKKKVIITAVVIVAAAAIILPRFLKMCIRDSFKAATVKDIKGEMQLFLQFAINRIRALSDGGGVLDIAKAYIEQYYMMDLDLDKVASICG